MTPTPEPAHDPAAVEVLGLYGVSTWYARTILNALTAADLSVVGEGYARIGGQVVNVADLLDACLAWRRHLDEEGYRHPHSSFEAYDDARRAFVAAIDAIRGDQ